MPQATFVPPMWGGGDAARSLLASSEERGPNTRRGCFRRLGLERGGAGLIIPFYGRSLPGVGPSLGWDPGAVDWTPGRRRECSRPQALARSRLSPPSRTLGGWTGPSLGAGAGAGAGRGAQGGASEGSLAMDTQPRLPTPSPSLGRCEAINKVMRPWKRGQLPWPLERSFMGMLGKGG